MKVVNVHQRLLHASPQRVGLLIDSLASPADALWPGSPWPRLKLDRPLGVGATGGHGPIGYSVEVYQPGHLVRCRFTAPTGFVGWHGFEILEATPLHCVLEHRIEMQTKGLARISWPLAIRHLHDALIEDALSKAQVSVGNTPQASPWSWRVRFLLWLLSRGRAGTKAATLPTPRKPHVL